MFFFLSIWAQDRNIFKMVEEKSDEKFRLLKRPKNYKMINFALSNVELLTNSLVRPKMNGFQDRLRL